MKVCVIGLGYIGLPTAAILAFNNIEVLGVDINQKIVETINKGQIHIEEPGLKDIIKETVQKGLLKASLIPDLADAFIIAVPTPNYTDEFFSCNLTYVLEATKTIIPYVKKGNIIILESTIEPRTMDDYIKPLFEEAGFIIGEDLYLAHCPERVLPGQILYELENNNRIVGGITTKCADKATEVYKKFVKGEIIKTEAKTAEVSKLMENTFRDVNIALANELTKICAKLDVNVLDVIKLANKHPRVNIHTPGPGVGGHCIAVDPYFIYAKVPEQSKLIKLARDINESMPFFVVDKVEKLVKSKDSKIACFGVTYKGNVDDTRKSPALKIIKILEEKGYNVFVHDPYVKSEKFVNFSVALTNAELLLILVDHDEFKNIDLKKVKKFMKIPIIFDTKGILKSNNDNVKLINYGNIYEIKE